MIGLGLQLQGLCNLPRCRRLTEKLSVHTDSRPAGFNPKRERTRCRGVGWPSEAISGTPLREAPSGSQMIQAGAPAIVPWDAQLFQR